MVPQILGWWVLLAAGGAVANEVECLVPEGCSDVGVDLSVGCATDLILSNCVNEAPCDLGHDVILVDNDQQKLAALKAGQVPIHENFLPELLQRHRGHKLNFSGKTYHVIGYQVRRDDERLDYDAMAKQAEEHRPKMIIAGGSAYPRQWDFARFRQIADSVGALLLVDMAHFSGLVAAGLHPNPCEYADIVTSTTHTFNNSGYTTRFEARREDEGSK